MLYVSEERALVVDKKLRSLLCLSADLLLERIEPLLGFLCYDGQLRVERLQLFQVLV